MRCQLRALGENRHIDVADPEAALLGEPPHLGEQHAAVDAAIARIRIGEVLTDVAGGDRAEQRIGDGVQHDIAVRVPQQAALTGHFDAAEAQRAAGNQAVDVPALSDPHQPPPTSAVKTAAPPPPRPAPA